MMLEDAIDVQRDKGKMLVYAAPMNGGKTQRNIALLKRISHSGSLPLAFTNDVNDRDSPHHLVSEGDYQFPARQIRHDHVREDVLRITAEVEEQYSRRVDVWALGEGQFLPREQLIPLLKENASLSNTNPKFIIVELLDPDFRGEPFPSGNALLSMADYPVRMTALCKMLRDGSRCTHGGARYNARLLRKDVLGFEEGYDIESSFIIDYPDNSETKVKGEYKFAPYFDKTIRVERTQDVNEKHDKDFIYVNACRSCFKIPGMDDTSAVLAYITSESMNRHSPSQDDLLGSHAQTPHLSDIVEFLVNERRIVFDGQFRHIREVKDPRFGFYLPEDGQPFPEKNKVYSFEKNDFMDTDD